VPVIKFLQVCPLPAAKTHLDQCAKLDPQAWRQSKSFVMPSAGGPSTKVPAGDKSQGKADANGAKTPAASAPSKDSSKNSKTSSEADTSAPVAPPKKTSQAAPSAGGLAPAQAQVAAAPKSLDAALRDAATRDAASHDGAENSVASGIVVAAIGVTPLAAAAIAEPAARPLAAWQVGGVFAAAGAALLSVMWWLLGSG
jgi:hypothetical protein